MKKNILIQPSASIREAMQELDVTAEKVLLVVDKEKLLLGSITDGDIRRYILQGHDLSDSIEKVYNNNPVFVYENEWEADSIKNMLIKRTLELIPVLDKQKRVVDYVVLGDIFNKEESLLKSKKTIEIPVVIMAGGKGARLDPFTRILPKPLIPIGNRPVIELIMDKFKEFGIEKCYLTINHMSKIIRAYFEESSAQYKITFIEEGKPLGTAGSLRFLQEEIFSDFFVTNCDTIIDADYVGIYEFHEKNQYDITVIASTQHYHIPYGICEIKNGGGLAHIKEKPEYSFLANTGMYILKKDVLKFIPENTFFNLTDLIEVLLKKEGNIGVYPVSEKSWIDVGEWDEYKKGVKLLLKS